MLQRRAAQVAGLALLSLLVFGCSTLPNEPAVNSNAEVANSRVAAANDLVPTPSSATCSVTSSGTIHGLLGGTVKAGRFTVIVPPGAFLGTATVTVTQPDPAQLQCQLSITPASANHFLVPVLLVADASQLDSKLLAVSFISWYNPATGKFERVPGSVVSLLNLTVSAPLWHFSTYRVEGKAGW